MMVWLGEDRIMKGVRFVLLVMALGVCLSGCSNMTIGPIGFAVAPMQPVHVGTPNVPHANVDYRTWGAWAFGSW